MNDLSSDFVSAVFVTRQMITNPSTYESTLLHVLNLPLQDRPCFGGCLNYLKTYLELFSEETQWTKAEWQQPENIVNRVFRTLLGVSESLYKTLPELAQDYVMERIPSRERLIVDSIRNKLSPNPRVIATTTNGDEIAIYDGWHTALAFFLENKEIPIYLGTRKAFTFYKTQAPI